MSRPESFQLSQGICITKGAENTLAMIQASLDVQALICNNVPVWVFIVITEGSFDVAILAKKFYNKNGIVIHVIS